MANITDKIPYCPLCDKKMQIVKTKEGLVFFVCIRRGCYVSCRTDDPMIPHWHSKEDQLDCGMCGHKMKSFLRQDGYVKAICKCGFKIESHDTE